MTTTPTPIRSTQSTAATEPVIDAGTVLSRATARALGISQRRLDGPEFQQVIHGVYTTGETARCWELYGATALGICGPGAMVTGVSALRLYGVQLPRQLEGDIRIHVAVPSGVPRSRRPQLSVHAHDDLPEPVQIGDLAVAPCEEAWLQVCESVAALACVEVGDGLVRYTDPLTSLNALERAIAANPGRRGIRTAMRALGMIRPGTDSLPETTTRIHLEAEGISGLLVNPTLRTRQGEFLGRVDMFDPATYTCVEYDGEVHGDEGQRRKDIARRRRIEDQGCPVIVAAAKDLYNPEGLARTVRRVQSEQAEALAARRLVDLPIVHPYEPALP